MSGRVLYCHCAFARVLPPATKSAVLAHLAASDLAVDCVPDLCEMSARQDPRLAALAAAAPLTIVACYERAVRGLFQTAGARLADDGVTVLNMRTDTADAILSRLSSPEASSSVASSAESAEPAPVDAS